jgi:uncharacterized glyoxalase superfamily metalloenzyme YdcJ
MSAVAATELRSAFARRIAALYGKEVPAYTTLVDTAQEVNAEVLEALGPAAERLGSIDRVTAERHAAIRVGTPLELSQVARIFGAMGMYPTGFYDLRDASSAAIPVVSTAFRPITCDELGRNPFRVFTSLLATADRRFFSDELAARLVGFLGGRELFAPRLLALAGEAERSGELGTSDATEFLELAVESFALSKEPVDRAWYRELEAVSAVAADIGGMRSTHINHITPRVLDIDELYARMGRRGIEMIDAIQGPPRWPGPDLLLRQTSFRALAEARRFLEPDGSVSEGALRVRFGEVEARGIALTARGWARYRQVEDDLARQLADDPGLVRDRVAAAAWARHFPATEHELAADDLGVFTIRAIGDRRGDGRAPPADLRGLLAGGWVAADPVVYEDFLPSSAAGIFQSNLSGSGSKDERRAGADLDADWLAGVLERPLTDPLELYAAAHEASLRSALDELGLPSGTVVTAGGPAAGRPSDAGHAAARPVDAGHAARGPADADRAEAGSAGGGVAGIGSSP